MRHALAIVAAEFRRNRFVLMAAPVIGLLPLIGHFLYQGAWLTPGQLGSVVPGLLHLTVSVAVAWGLGANAVSRDLAERRLGFWLVRPVSLLSYWSGKVLAAWLLAVLAGCLVELPAVVLGLLKGPGDALALIDRAGAVAEVLAVLVAVVGTAHSAVRTRSRMIVLDLVMVPVAVYAFLFTLSEAAALGAGSPVDDALPWMVRAGAVVLLAANAAQIAAGRLDLRRGHLVLSAVTWTGLLTVFVGGAYAVMARVAWARPSGTVSVSASVRGDHVVIQSYPDWEDYSDAGARLSFLVGGRDRPVSLGANVDRLVWSDSGRYVALERNIGSSGNLIEVRDIDREGPSIRFGVARLSLLGPPIRLGRDPIHAVALSPSGSRVLLRSGLGHNLVGTASGQTLATAAKTGTWHPAVFVSDSTVRALERQLAGPTRVVEWNFATGGPPRVLGSLPQPPAEPDPRLFEQALGRFVPAADFDSVLRSDRTGLFLHELDGRVRATLMKEWPRSPENWSRDWRGPEWRLPWWTAGALSGGRWGCITAESTDLRLRVFDGAGRLSSDVRFPGRFPVRVGGEPRAGLLAIGHLIGYRTLLVEMATGAVVRNEAGLQPAVSTWAPEESRDAPHLEPGSFSTRLMHEAWIEHKGRTTHYNKGGLVLLDPDTGRRTVLVPARERMVDR